MLLTDFDSNKALGGNGANGANGGLGGAALETTAGGRVVHFGGAAGGFGETGGAAGVGGANRNRTGAIIGHGQDGHGGQGGNGGNGGGGGMGGDGGDPGDGGSGGDGLGGGIYLAGGTLTLVQGSMTNNEALGGAGGNGGAGGVGGAAGVGGPGAVGGNGGAGVANANRTGAGGHGGNGGNGGDGGDGGAGGRAGHAGNGGNGEGGDIYVASGFSVSLNRTPLSGTARGGKAGAVGALGAGGAGGMGGQGGHAGVGGVGNPNGASGTDGGAGNDGSPGTPGAASGPASDGTSAGDTVFGPVGSETTPPTVMLSAANVTSANAAGLNPYTFTVTYSDPVLVNGSSVSAAVVQVQLPNGSTITATPINIMLSGIQDGQGDAQTITVTYQITPPGGSWSSAPNGTYAINLVSNPPTDLAGNAVAVGTLGSFSVNVATGPAPPVINAISPQTVADGTPLQFTVTATSPTGAPLTYSLGAGAPPGASINPQTGQFSWTPSEANGVAPGVYNVTITATEATTPPLSSSTTVSITVGPSSTNQGSGIAGREFVTLGLAQSAEYYQHVITAAYQQFLGRAPDTVGFASWLTQMQNHVLSDQRLDAAFTSSAEYLAHHGGAGQDWIVSLYQNLLNRTPGASEVQYWLNQLAAGESPASVAFAFANSVERQSNLVASYYQQYLRRSAQPVEINGWVNQLENGMLTNEQVIAAFVSSQEYYQERGGNIVDWLYAAYRSVLNREADTGGYQFWLQRLQ